MRTRHVDLLERRWLFATVVPSGFADELFDNGLANPTAMEFAPDGRLFVAEQGGNVRVIQNGVLLTNSFVSLNVDSAGERGVLGLAFDPAFTTNGFLYVYYTVPNGADGNSGAFNRVSRFTAADADGNPANGYTPGNVAAAGSGTILLNLNPLSSATNHNGGALHFGPDGKLYLAVGENANTSNAQTLANHHGKILRLNVDGTAPPDNPFNDQDAAPNEPRDYIWALGLRNPFTTAFDPVTGRFHINDVGAGSWEEVNLGAAGANYGWPTYEGPENDPNFGTPPIFAYSHSASGNNGGSVISGGTFYRPAAHAFPSQYGGDYFFAEAGRGWIRSYDVSTGTAALFATGASFPVDLKTGNDGALYYLERGSGSVRRIRATTPPPPTWLAPGSVATWDPGTKALTVTGAASIIADPGADSPLITANGAAAVLTINPTSGRAVHVGGLTLAGGATATLTSVGSGGTAAAAATSASLDSSTRKAARGTAVRPGARPKPQLTSLLAAAALRTAANSRVLVVNGNTFNIDVNSKLDLVDNNLILNYSGTSPAAGVESMVRAGYNGGDWLGKRITSSTANADRNFALGVADNSQLVIPFTSVRPFAGQAVDTTAVLVKFTHRVDLDLDGVITTNDATIFNSNYSEGAAARWGTGDVDFDGLFTSNDATLFNGYYDESLGAV